MSLYYADSREQRQYSLGKNVCLMSPVGKRASRNISGHSAYFYPFREIRGTYRRELLRGMDAAKIIFVFLLTWGFPPTL